MEDEQTKETNSGSWAIVELMGHSVVPGILSKPTEWAGLLRLDIPIDNGFRTELLGPSAIYRVRFVSEEIARMTRPSEQGLNSYDVPVMTLEKHQKIVDDLHERIGRLQRQIQANIPMHEQEEF